jgi:predicted metal-binding membrane protein
VVAVARERLVAAQRGILVSALAFTTAACWAYVIHAHAQMAADRESQGWIVVTVWMAMMTGMMLPSAAPMFLSYVQIAARQSRASWRPVFAFVLTYVSLWIVISALGAWTQHELAGAGMVSHLGASTRPWLSGVLLVLAGALT